MIIDCRKSPGIGSLFHVVDVATGDSLAGKVRHLFYADDAKAIYRCYDQDDRGMAFTRSVATRSRLDHIEGLRTDHPVPVFADGTRGGEEEIAWTEYYLPIRIEPKPDLNKFERRFALELLAAFEAEAP